MDLGNKHRDLQNGGGSRAGLTEQQFVNQSSKKADGDQVLSVRTNDHRKKDSIYQSKYLVSAQKSALLIEAQNAQFKQD